MTTLQCEPQLRTIPPPGSDELMMIGDGTVIWSAVLTFDNLRFALSAPPDAKEAHAWLHDSVE